MSSINTQIIMSPHVNGMGRLFGGQLMSWIDIIGAVEARRWAKCDVTTAAVDNLAFLQGAVENDTIVLQAKLTWTGHTSMEVCVCTYLEDPNNCSLSLINKAYLVFVAVNSIGQRLSVPMFVPSTEEEKAEWDKAVIRKQIRLGK